MTSDIGQPPVAGRLLKATVAMWTALGVTLTVSGGCLVTDPVYPASPPPVPEDTPPRIDMNTVSPTSNVLTFDVGQGCPALTFQIGGIVDPDAAATCNPDGGFLAQPQQFQARFFATPLPPPAGFPGNAVDQQTLTCQRSGCGAACDIVSMPAAFTLHPNDSNVNKNGWTLVEIVVSDYFSEEGLGRTPKAGYGIDSASWVVSNPGCPAQ